MEENKNKKPEKEGRIIPAGTKQETGFSRFIKKPKKTGNVVIKDAKANNQNEIENDDL